MLKPAPCLFGDADFIERKQIGFESIHFLDDEIPPCFPAFVRTVMRFSDEAIRAIVGTARIRNPEAEAYLTDTLIARRDKIVRHWLARINPIDGFEVTTSGNRRELSFVNLGIEAGLATACRYGYAWHTFGNDTGVYQAIGAPGVSPGAAIPVPDIDADFLMVKLSSNCVGQPAWTSEVDVYIRAASMSVVGVERDDPQQ